MFGVDSSKGSGSGFGCSWRTGLVGCGIITKVGELGGGGGMENATFVLYLIWVAPRATIKTTTTRLKAVAIRFR